MGLQFDTDPAIIDVNEFPHNSSGDLGRIVVVIVIPDADVFGHGRFTNNVRIHFPAKINHPWIIPRDDQNLVVAVADLVITCEIEHLVLAEDQYHIQILTRHLFADPR